MLGAAGSGPMALTEKVLLASKRPNPQREPQIMGPQQPLRTSPHISLLHVETFACTLILHM